MMKQRRGCRMTFIIDQNYYGFTLIDERELSELGAIGRVFEHDKSGARLFYVQNKEDDNKVFSITFRTPPHDSTGLPHILEHSVLCGSEKFPLKDPFIELAKGSLNTFLNAMTYPDKTMYPIASRNDKDFQNLVDVYMDAVLHPNIYHQPEILMQEGWHYALDNLEDEIIYKGVVYNEMKGAFSSPEQILFRKIQQSLFPGTPYGVESGGDPDDIPNLTYEDFINFHKRYYHPSNSYIYLYGDMDIDFYLKWLDQEYLQSFDRISLDSNIPLQSAFEEQVQIEVPYPIATNEKEENKTYISYNAVVGTSLDPKLNFSFDVLEHVLLGAEGAPLKKALLEAGIGKDVFGSYDNSILQPVFTIVSKDADMDQIDDFHKVINDTLQALVEKGIDKKLILSTINTLEFRLREADFGHRPKGLTYNILSLNSWLYDGDPMMHLEYEQILEDLKLATQTSYFEDLIQRYLLGNPHSSTVIVKPEKGLSAKREEEIKKELREYKASLSTEELQRLIEQTQKLKEFQSEPTPQEDLEKIPLLSLKDINPKAEQIPQEEKEISGIKILHHPLFTNHITYLNFLFPLYGIREEEIPYVGLLARILGKVSTEMYPYEELAKEINLSTGGIHVQTSLYGKSGDSKAYTPTVSMRGKALTEHVPTLLSLMGEIIKGTKYEGNSRLKDLIAETKSRLEMGMMSQGHTVAANRAESYFSPMAYYQELTQGISYYQFIANLDQEFESKKDEIVRNLQAVAQKIFCPSNMIVAVTGETKEYEAFATHFDQFLQGLPDKSEQVLQPEFALQAKNEGILTSGKIQYVAKAGNFIDSGYQYTGTLQVLRTIASLDYLWKAVRVSGGAYGCMAGFSRTGSLYFASYRDPNLVETLKVYDQMDNYIRNFTADEREMTKYIIGTMSRVDFPLSPSNKGEQALAYYMSGMTPEMIQKEREQILNTTEKDIRNLADLLKDTMEQNYICVVGNENKLQQEKEIFNELVDLFQ